MTCAVREAVFVEPTGVTSKSMPPQFQLSLKRVMPSAGWSFEVDSVELDAENHRIVVQVTVRRPSQRRPCSVDTVSTMSAMELSGSTVP